MSELTYSLEVQGMVQLLRNLGVTHRVTDVNTPGVHSSGGYHYMAGTGAKGLAVDVAWLQPYRLNPPAAKAGMLAICAALEPYEHRFAELICSHLPYSIKNGRRVARYAIDDHWDHVHLAVERGVFLAAIPDPMEVIVVPDNPEIPNLKDLKFFVPIVRESDGTCTGYYMVSSIGEVHSHGPGAPYYGRSEVVDG